MEYIDTGPLLSDGNAILGAEIAWVHGPLSLQSEIKSSWLELIGGDRVKAWGAYAQVGYFLTGEHRVYKKKSAVFTRVKPANSFDPAQGKWGAFEVAARYSYINLNDKGATLNGGEQQDLTLGLTWHVFSNVKMMANYVHADVKDSGSVIGNATGNLDIFQMRAQIEF